MSRRIKKNTIKAQESVRDKVSNRKTKFHISKKSTVTFDRINIEIFRSILINPDIKSSEIAKLIDIPLSTIQRRRSKIESSHLLQKNFVIDYHRLGLRIADLLIKISKGDIEKIINDVIKQHSKSILEVTVRIGHPDINLVVRIAYKNNDEIYEIMRTVNKIENLESVQWSEILKEIKLDRQGLLENLFSRIKSI